MQKYYVFIIYNAYNEKARRLITQSTDFIVINACNRKKLRAYDII